MNGKVSSWKSWPLFKCRPLRSQEEMDVKRFELSHSPSSCITLIIIVCQQGLV